MHQRTWLTVLTFPLVANFTYPVLVHQAPKPPTSESVQGTQDPLAGLSDIQDVLSLVRDNYVDPPDMEKVISGGVQASLERAHPLNAYLTADELRLPDPGPAEAGLMLVKRGIWAVVMSVTPDGPAAKAGVMPGDVVRKMEGESVGALSAWTLERKLRGNPGSELTLLNYTSLGNQLKKVVIKREILKPTPIGVRRDAKASVVTLPDLVKGRAAELKAVLSGLDHKLPLVLDLRNCAGGELDEAVRVAGFFASEGTVVTVQESGKPDRNAAVIPSKLPSFAKVAVLQGLSTIGPSEALAAFLKKQSMPTIGDHSAALGVERTRILLRQGGAVEIVYRRWLGAGGEKLDRQGVAPAHPLKYLQPNEDPLPKVLDILGKDKSAKVYLPEWSSLTLRFSTRPGPVEEEVA